MSRLSEDELRRLGLPLDAVYECVDVQRAPPSDVTEGASGIRLTLAALAAQFAASGANPEVRVRGLVDRVGDVSVQRSFERPTIVCVSPLAATVHVEGPHEVTPDGEWFIDSRGDEPVLVRLHGERGDGALRILHGEVGFYAVPDGVDAAELAALSAAAVVPAVPSPDVDALVARLATPRWLVDEARGRAASNRSLSRVAAAGMIARLWHPEGRQADVMDVLASPDGAPSERALRWYRALPFAVTDAVLRAALRETERLADELPDLQAHALDEDPGAREDLRAWLHARDDLESVAVFVRRGDGRERIDRALRALDDRASSFHTMYASMPAFVDDKRLCAVAFTDPDAWWGRTALG